MRLPQQLCVFVLSAFAVLALALATVGLYGVVSYGVVSYGVAQRRARSVSGRDSAPTQAVSSVNSSRAASSSRSLAAYWLLAFAVCTTRLPGGLLLEIDVLDLLTFPRGYGSC